MTRYRRVVGKCRVLTGRPQISNHLKILEGAELFKQCFTPGQLDKSYSDVTGVTRVTGADVTRVTGGMYFCETY